MPNEPFFNVGGKLFAIKEEADRADYSLFVAEIGLTEDDMEAVRLSIEYDKFAPLPEPLYRRESLIHGDGLFTTKAFAGPIERVDGNWTCTCVGCCYGAGEFTLAGAIMNHGLDPNAMVQPFAHGLFIFATKKIEIGEEITVNYRQMREVVGAFRKLEESL